MLTSNERLSHTNPVIIAIHSTRSFIIVKSLLESVDAAINYRSTSATKRGDYIVLPSNPHCSGTC